MKRGIDLILSAALLLFAMPFMLLIAVVIKLSSRGPVFFRQERIGRFGIAFKIVKFRTMTVSDKGPGITIAGDQRVTFIGQFLRKWKLDELPQLWNILKGEMSFVGPRPEIPEFVAKYRPGDMVIFGMRPGLTDLATLKYRNEEKLLARQPDPLNYYLEVILPDKLHLAHQYALKRSLAVDFKIIFFTVLRIAKFS